MAITNFQHPGYLHTVNLPAYYTAGSSEASLTSNFKYRYKVKTRIGTVFTGSSFPVGNLLVGTFNPSDVLKSALHPVFEPSVKTYTPVPNWYHNYYINVEEDLGPAGGGSISNFFKAAGYSAWNKLFNFDDHVMKNNGSEFLSMMPTFHHIRYNDEYVFRAPNGYVDPTDSARLSSIQQYRVEMFMTGKLYLLVPVDDNPYHNAAQSPSPTNVVSLDDFMLDLPAGPANLDKKHFNILGYWTYDGPGDGGEPLPTQLKTDWTWHDELKPDTVVPFMDWIRMGMIKYYNYYVYDEAKGRMSEIHTFDPLVECVFEPVQVSWLNSLGGYDFYTFTKKNVVSKAYDHETYDRNPYLLEGAVVHELDRGETIYFSSEDDYLSLMTDFLDQDQIDGLYDMFSSPDIHAKVNGKWYAMLNRNNKVTNYNKRSKSFYQYEITLKFANKLKFTV